VFSKGLKDSEHFSSGLFENFEDNFEKKVEGLEELIADVS